MRSGPARTGLLVAAAGALAVTGAAGPASAAAARANWQMDERAGTTVMVDRSGHGLDGQIGARVQTHTVIDGRLGYLFPHTTNLANDPADPEHLVVVPDSPTLNPGTGDYSVTVTTRFGPSANYRNLVQKGQSTTGGGFFKLEVDHGGVTCVFRGSGGRASVSTGLINDKTWHTVTCARTAGAVTMTVDGVVGAARSVATGNIVNGEPLAIGGKADCANPDVECDYFAGYVDQVVIG